jgi:hypothetical protein
MAGSCPDVGLVLGDPIGLRLVLKMPDGPGDADQREGGAPARLDLRNLSGTALIEPDDRGAQRSAVFVEVHYRAALRRDRDAAERGLRHRGFAPQTLAGLTERLPIPFRVMLDPTRFAREISGERHLRFRHQLPGEIEEQRTHALRTVVDGKNVIVGHEFPFSSC